MAEASGDQDPPETVHVFISQMKRPTASIRFSKSCEVPEMLAFRWSSGVALDKALERAGAGGRGWGGVGG